MLIAIVGEDFSFSQMGNLKTYFMTWNLKMDYDMGRPIFANYKLMFPYHKINSFSGLLKILDKIEDASIGIDELSVYWDAYSLPSKNNGTWYLKTFARQTRKKRVKGYYTAQSFEDIHRSLRKITGKIYITKKLHEDGNQCFDEFCYKPHVLSVYDFRTNVTRLYRCDLSIFGMYDSDEIVTIED